MEITFEGQHIGRASAIRFTSRLKRNALGEEGLEAVIDEFFDSSLPNVALGLSNVLAWE